MFTVCSPFCSTVCSVRFQCFCYFVFTIVSLCVHCLVTFFKQCFRCVFDVFNCCLTVCSSLFVHFTVVQCVFTVVSQVFHFCFTFVSLFDQCVVTVLNVFTFFNHVFIFMITVFPLFFSFFFHCCVHCLFLLMFTVC